MNEPDFLNSRCNYGLGKTHSSASSAFRDADYATGLWRCETPNQYAWRYTKYWLLIALLGGILLGVLYLFGSMFVELF